MTAACHIELCMECAGTGQVTRWWHGWPWEPEVCISCRGSGDAIVVGLDTVQIPVRPREYEIHLVRATAAIGGGCPITACLCGFDHHAADVGFSRRGGSSGSVVRQIACLACVRVAREQYPGLHTDGLTDALDALDVARLAIETLAEVQA